MTAYHNGEMVEEEEYHLAEEMEVFDAELYAIEKATEIATKYTNRHRELNKSGYSWTTSKRSAASGLPKHDQDNT